MTNKPVPKTNRRKQPLTPAQQSKRDKAIHAAAIKQVSSKPKPIKPKQRPMQQQRVTESAAVRSAGESYDAMCKYLYGFGDPAVAGRGPNINNNSTVILTFDLTQNLVLSAFDADTPAYISSDPGTTVGPNNAGLCMLNSSGAIALCVSPQINYNWQTTDGMPAWSISSGVTFDTAVIPALQQGYVRASTQSKMGPLAYFPNVLPTGPPTENDSDKGLTPISYRTVGLRTVLEVTTPAMTAQGVVMAGDNSDFYATIPKLHVNANGSDVTEPDNRQAFPVNQQFYTSAKSVTKVGAFSNGARYEACWKPGNDAAIYWSDVGDKTAWMQQGTESPPHYYQNNPVLATTLLNSYCNIFRLEGMVPGQTLTLQTTWAVEVPTMAGSTIGVLWREARLAGEFVTQWGKLACHNAGGLEGNFVKCLLKCAEGQRGYRMAVAGHASPGTMPNFQSGQGPKPSTLSIVAHDIKVGADYALKGAAVLNPVVGLGGWVADKLLFHRGKK